MGMQPQIKLQNDRQLNIFQSGSNQIQSINIIFIMPPLLNFILLESWKGIFLSGQPKYSVNKLIFNTCILSKSLHWQADTTSHTMP